MLEKPANEGFMRLSVVDDQSSFSISATAVLCITQCKIYIAAMCNAASVASCFHFLFKLQHFSQQDKGEQRGQPRLVWFTESVLVFIVIERFYDQIFLFMFSGPWSQTAQPHPLISLSICSLSCCYHFFPLFVCVYATTYTHIHIHTQVRGKMTRMDKGSFLTASKFKDRLP